MKAILRALLGWLDRKFPDRVVVTDVAYKQLLATQTAQSNHLIELRRKIGELEAGSPDLKEIKAKLEVHQNEINKLNIANGFWPQGMPKQTASAILER